MIPFIDLAAQQAHIRSSIEKRIRTVLDHGRYIMGPEVGELEGSLAEFAGTKYAVGCSSGTDALLMALMAYNVGPGDLILTTPFTFIATAEVISLVGATPVFVDIDAGTFNLSPFQVEKAVQACLQGDDGIHPLPKSAAAAPGDFKLKGIIAVDLFGLPADYDLLVATARRHNLFLIEDAAQSFGATYRGRKAGGLGDLGATSFFPAKPLGAYGDGGAIFIDDEDLAARLRSIRVHGEGTDKYDNIRVGLNGRLDTLQAAVLLEKLTIFPKEIEARNRVAQAYHENLNDLVTTPRVPEDCTSVWAQYSVLSPVRDKLMAALKAAGVPTAIYYPKPLHLQTAYQHLGYEPGAFPVSENAAKTIFSLPMHPYLQKEQIELIADTIAKGLAG